MTSIADDGLPAVRDSAWLRDAALLTAARGGELELGDTLSQQLDAAWSGCGLAGRPGEAVIVVGASTPVTAAQAVGNAASVLVIDPDATRLAQAGARGASGVARPARATFREAPLTDWRLRFAFIAEWLNDHPIRDLDGYRGLEGAIAAQRSNSPLVADETADRVILDLVLNRLPPGEARTVLDEACRALRRTGVLVMSVLLADEPPAGLPLDGLDGLPLASLPLESALPDVLKQAGWDAIRFAWRADLPLRVVAGIELRLHVLEARKRPGGRARDQGHAVIYRGPWQAVTADDGTQYVRGERTAVSNLGYAQLSRAPLVDDFLTIPPYSPVPPELAPDFDAATPRTRHPRVSKGARSVFDERRGPNGSCCP